MYRLDYQSSDLNVVETLKFGDYDDVTCFLSVPPERYEMLSSISKKQDVSTTQKHPVWLLKNPLGTIINLLIIYSLWFSDIYARNRSIIDHYLGKDTVNNILATRFSNILLEPLWNRQYMNEVQIFATETVGGCEGRSQYYEDAGVVRDILQNHMLQVLALIAMEPPCNMTAKEIRREKTRFLLRQDLAKNLFVDNMNLINLKRVLIQTVRLQLLLLVICTLTTGVGRSSLLLLKWKENARWLR